MSTANDVRADIPTSLPGALPTALSAAIEQRADDDGEGLRFEGRSWTWAEVVAEMRRRAGWLAARRWDGPRHVGVLLDNVPEFVFLLGGAALSGSVVVGLNPTRRGSQLQRDIRHTECGVVVTSEEHAGLLDDLDLGALEVHLIDDDAWDAAIENAPALPDDWPAPTGADLLLLLFTAGSTGAPKAVRFSQGRAAAAAERMWFSPDDVLYCPMPMFHGNALNSTIFPAIGKGATVVLKRRFSASELLEDVRAHGCTFFSTVGRALTYVLETPRSSRDRDHDLKVVLAPEASLADTAAFEERFGVTAVSGYGSSENAVILVPQPGLPPGALGTPLEGLDVAVVDPDTLDECPPARFTGDGTLANPEEAVGEIVGRAALDRFEGYWNNPEAEAARSRNGWYWTGDLGYRDESGIFYFAGRTAEWIRVDGENLASAPLERLFARFDGVSEAVAVGVPDERTVDDQILAVLQVDDVEAFDPAGFDRFLSEQPDLGTKWSPRYVRVVDRLPATAVNKIDRAGIRHDGWDVDDPVFWRPDRRGGLRPMTQEDRATLRRLHVSNRRGSRRHSGSRSTIRS